MINKLSTIFDESYLKIISEQTGFIKRSRKISASAFLRSLLYRHFEGSKHSLNDQVMDLMVYEEVSLRKQSLHDRYNVQAVEFVKQILSDQMKNQIGIKDSDLYGTFPSIFVQDATRFKLPEEYKSVYPGYSNQRGQSSGMGIQFVYDVKQSTINYINLHSALANDSVYANQLEWLTPGSLLIRDLGYFSMDAIKNIEKKQAYYLSRLKPKTTLYKREGNELTRIDMGKLLSKMKRYNIPFIEDELYVSTSDKVISRVCIFLMPEKVRQERIRKNKTTNKGKKHSCTEEFGIWSAFNIFITNVSQEQCSIEAISKLYKIRWQIELVFKTWKSYYRIDRIKSMKLQRIECYMYASLLYFYLNWQLYNSMQLAYQDIYISHIKFTKFILLNKDKMREVFTTNNNTLLKYILNKIDKKCIQLEIKKGKTSSIEIAQYHRKKLSLNQRKGKPGLSSKPFPGTLKNMRLVRDGQTPFS